MPTDRRLVAHHNRCHVGDYETICASIVAAGSVASGGRKVFALEVMFNQPARELFATTNRWRVVCVAELNLGRCLRSSNLVNLSQP